MTSLFGEGVMSAPNAKHKRRVEQDPQKITQPRSHAVSTHQARPDTRPHNARDVQAPFDNGVRPTSIPLPNFNDPTTLVHQQGFVPHRDHWDWEIKIGWWKFRIHLWGRRTSNAEEKSLRTENGAEKILSISDWNTTKVPKDYRDYEFQSGDFFSPGRVFAIPWPIDPETCFSGAISKRERLLEQPFVIIRYDETGPFALPISTYSGRGVAALGAVAWQHSIIYTSEHAPSPLPEERPPRGERGLQPASIKVRSSDRNQRLPPTSRVNYGEGYYIEPETPVRKIGKVSDDALKSLLHTYQSIWRSISNCDTQSTSGASKRDSGVVTPSSSRDQQQSIESQAYDMSNIKAAMPCSEPLYASGTQLPRNEYVDSRQVTTTFSHPGSETTASIAEAQRFAQVMGTDILTLQRLRLQDPQKYAAYVQEYRRRESAVSHNDDDEEGDEEGDEEDDEDDDNGDDDEDDDGAQSSRSPAASGPSMQARRGKFDARSSVPRSYQPTSTHSRSQQQQLGDDNEDDGDDSEDD